jgi:hypothetical protein
MEILATYDLTGSLRATAELTGCSHHTVARHVAARNVRKPISEPAYRGRVTDPFMPKIEEWVEASRGRIRADKAHEKLLALGYAGSERSTRSACNARKASPVFSGQLRNTARLTRFLSAISRPGRSREKRTAGGSDEFRFASKKNWSNCATALARPRMPNQLVPRSWKPRSSSVQTSPPVRAN